jgi:predicted negative regulator of RcsB-dependent stress response
MAAEKKAKQSEGLFVSASAMSIAKALHAKYPKEAAEIVHTMEEASKSDSTTKKLARVRLALVFLQGGAR